LETIRRYCADLDPDPSKTRDAHAAWVRRYVADNALLLLGRRSRDGFDALHAELPNIRAGIAHDVAHHPHDALRTVAPADWFWSSLAIPAEGVGVIRRALDACPDASPADRAAALIALSHNMYRAGDPEAAANAADDAIAAVPISPQASDEWRLLAAQARLQRVAPSVDLGDIAAAKANLEGYFTSVVGVTVPAWLQSCALLCEGLMQYFLLGDLAGGIDTLHRAGELGRECGFAWTEGAAAILLARFTLADGGDVKFAVDAVARAVAAFGGQGNTADLLTSLHCGAHCLFRLGAVRDAVRLRAAIVEHADRMGHDTTRFAILAGGDNEARLCEALAEPDRSIAEAEGRAMRFDEISTVFHDLVAAL